MLLTNQRSVLRSRDLNLPIRGPHLPDRDVEAGHALVHTLLQLSLHTGDKFSTGIKQAGLAFVSSSNELEMTFNFIEM